MIWNKLKTHLQYNYGQHCWILRWICCFNEWKQTWTLKRRNWNKLRMTSVLGSLHPTGDAADFLVQPWMTYWQQYWPLTFCSHEVFSVPSGSDMIPKWTASVHTRPVFLWAVCLHGTFLLLSAFGGSGGNKNRSSTTSDCLHVQKGRVLNRSPAYLYKTVYTLLLLSFFSFWDQHPKNVVDLYRRVDKRLHIKKRKQKCCTGPIVSGLKVPFTRAKRNGTARIKSDTWPFESTM